MTIKIIYFCLILFFLISIMSCDSRNSANEQNTQNLAQKKGETTQLKKLNSDIKTKKSAKLMLERIDHGFFQIKKPKNWTMVYAGQCSLFAFIIRDPQNPVNQIFYFSSVGPVYMSLQQKQIDANYMNSGGYPVQWFEMPVISPFNPENFLIHWQQIAATNIARQFIPQPPQLNQLQIIHTQTQASGISGNGLQTKLIRAVFSEGGRAAQGLFSVTTAPTIPFMNGPGGGVGYGFMIAGITSNHSQFKYLQQDLLKCLESFTLEESYVRQCLQTQQETWRGIMKAGQTLRETSDMITRSWEQRNKTYDILAEKWSDTILSKERLYDPHSGEVYQFDNGFYDQYQLQNQQYNKSDLIPLPNNNADLWDRPALNGYQHIKKTN